MTVWIGTSGWQYDDWRGPVYPAALRQREWLESYATRFATVESNNAFYHLPERRVFEAWAERAPADFVMAGKGRRYPHHIKRPPPPCPTPSGSPILPSPSPGSSIGPAVSARSSGRRSSSCRRSSAATSI